MKSTKDNYNILRLDTFQTEIAKMFLAYNRPIQKTTIEAKANLMNETLSSLRTDKITVFFKYVRESSDILPTDGALKKILRSKADEFSKRRKLKELPPSDPEDLPDDEWLAQYHAGVKLVLMGEMTPEQVKKELGV